MPILRTKDAQGNITLNVVMGAGISTITQGMPVCITLMGGLFKIKERFSKKAPVTLKCSQIINIQELHHMELISKRNDGLKKVKTSTLPCRFPGLVEGTRNSKGKLKDFIVINYGSTSKKVIIFEKIAGTTLGSEEFIKEIQRRANIIA